ncbi:hypothetical protein AOLI_G00153300 [Acnodon oligacanthus]
MDAPHSCTTQVVFKCLVALLVCTLCNNNKVPWIPNVSDREPFPLNGVNASLPGNFGKICGTPLGSPNAVSLETGSRKNSFVCFPGREPSRGGVGVTARSEPAFQSGRSSLATHEKARECDHPRCARGKMVIKEVDTCHMFPELKTDNTFSELGGWVGVGEGEGCAV